MMDNRNKTTTDNDIELKAGHLAGQYSCVYDGVNGVLYAGSKSLYFVGTYFLFDKKLHLAWEAIRQVVRMEGGIRIWTKGDECVDFTAMHQPARIWPLLVSLHNDALLGRSVPTTQMRGRTDSVELKRRNSDPSAAMSVMNPLLTLDVDEGDELWLQQQAPPPTGTAAVVPAAPRASPKSDASRKHYQAATVAETRMAGHGTGLAPTHPVVVLGLTEQEVQEKLGTIKLAPIACTHDKLPGTLYVGQQSLYFYAKKFFWDIRRLFFPIHTVRQFQILAARHSKETTTTDNNKYGYERQGIAITDRSGQIFEFEDMENPDHVWASLLALHNENLVHRNKMSRRLSAKDIGDLAHHDLRGGGGGGRNPFVRMNSDPDLATQRTTMDHAVSTMSTAVPFAQQTTSPKTPSSLPQERTFKKATSSPVGPSTSPPKKGKPSKAVSQGAASPLRTTTSTISVESTAPPLDMEREWAKVIEKKNGFPNLVVEKLELQCSMDQFVEHFLADAATHSLAAYLESRGDSALKSSQWKPHEPDGAPSQLKRVINYSHPVNAPLAPPQAGARKEQTLTRYGSFGLCVETRTIVDDVPMADCFRVDDRIRVQPSGSGNIAVSMEFTITFVKSTMFKSIISKTTRSEFTDFFEQMGVYMTNALGGKTPAPPPAEMPPRGGSIEAPAETMSMGPKLIGTLIQPFLLALVVILQLYIMNELRGIKATMATMAGSNAYPDACPGTLWEPEAIDTEATATNNGNMG